MTCLVYSSQSQESLIQKSDEYYHDFMYRVVVKKFFFKTTSFKWTYRLSGNGQIFAMLSKLYLTVIGIIMQLKKSYAFIRDRYNLSQEKETQQNILLNFTVGAKRGCGGTMGCWEFECSIGQGSKEIRHCPTN